VGRKEFERFHGTIKKTEKKKARGRSEEGFRTGKGKKSCKSGTNFARGKGIRGTLRVKAKAFRRSPDLHFDYKGKTI